MNYKLRSLTILYLISGILLFLIGILIYNIDYNKSHYWLIGAGFGMFVTSLLLLISHDVNYDKHQQRKQLKSTQL